MADFKACNKFDKNKNDYYTVKECWSNITPLISKDKIIWEACMFNSKSKSLEYWKELGYKVVGDTKWDCLEIEPIKYDIIITNPPFETTIKKKILHRFFETNKPFIIVFNSCNIFTKYIREIFGDKIKDLQVVIPRKRIQFEQFDENQQKIIPCKCAPFYSVYLCYKCNIPTEKLWL